MVDSSSPNRPATADDYRGEARPLPIGVAALIIAAGSALGWAVIVGIAAVVLQL
jgi:hypothetical protein